jgi:hypothetical protein
VCDACPRARVRALIQASELMGKIKVAFEGRKETLGHLKV